MNTSGTAGNSRSCLSDLMIQVLVILSLSTFVLSGPICQHLSKRQMHEMLQQSYVLGEHDSFSMHPEFLQQTTESGNHTGREHLDNIDGLVQIKYCPTTVQSSGPLNRRTLCPSHLVNNIDRDRYPEVLMEAQCNCQSCIGQQGFSCQKIYYHTRVIRRDPSGICSTTGGHIYKHSLQKIAVGCVCAKNLII